MSALLIQEMAMVVSCQIASPTRPSGRQCTSLPSHKANGARFGPMLLVRTSSGGSLLITSSTRRREFSLRPPSAE